MAEKLVETKDNISQRLYSLDALRGFDMFWIIAGEHIVHGMAKASGAPFWKAFSYQLDHAEWNGFRAYDLIFPLFIFLAGVSTPYSVGRELEKGTPKKDLVMRTLRRILLLVLLGVFKGNGLTITPLAELRICSVLGRIGLAWGIANIIYIYTKDKGQLIWCAALLIGYWLLLKFTSAPGYPPGDLTMQGNFASCIDRCVMPGKLFLDIHDPEGLISTIPAISTGLMGIFAGKILKNSPLSPTGKALRLAVIGVSLIIGAVIWNFDFPINKNLWTSSFVLLTAGLSFLLLSLFYYIIDVLGYHKWAFFFRVIGMNSILIYISSRFIQWDHANNAFFQWAGQLAGEPYKIVVMAMGFTLVKWFFLYFLYRKKVFLRV